MRILLWTCSGGGCHPLLRGVCLGAVTLEGYVALSARVEHTSNLWPTSPHISIHLEGLADLDLR